MIIKSTHLTLDKIEHHLLNDLISLTSATHKTDAVLQMLQISDLQAVLHLIQY